MPVACPSNLASSPASNPSKDDVGSSSSPQPAETECHLTLCPKPLLAAIINCDEVKCWITEISRAVGRESLFNPTTRLLSEVSERVFEYLQVNEDKDRLHLPNKPIVFIDHHRHTLTHYPIDTSNVLEERNVPPPDIIGVVGGDHGYRIAEDGTYEGVPYHRVETLVDVKDINRRDHGKSDAIRSADRVQDARPDRPGFYCLSIDSEHFQIIFTSPLCAYASEHKSWTDTESLCAFVYSLYDPPEGHVLYDRTLTAVEPPAEPLGKPTWTIKTSRRTYRGASIIFVGGPDGKRTTVFRVKEKHCPGATIIKDSFLYDDFCFVEERLNKYYIHRDGFVPGVVRIASAEDVKNGEDAIEIKVPEMRARRKHRIVIPDFGYDLTLAKSVNDLLMAIYDALEVHRTLARDRSVLHRDMSMFNILMYPTMDTCVSGWPYMKNTPPLIDDVLNGEIRSLEERKARCLIIDFDNAATLDHETTDAQLQHHGIGTPTYIARNAAAGSIYNEGFTSRFTHKMPELTGAAKDLYVKAHGEDRYARYNDGPETFHGGVPAPCPSDSESDPLPREAYYHRWEYDAESIFWTMFVALIRVVPQASPEESGVSQFMLDNVWQTLLDHTIPDAPGEWDDPRESLLRGPVHRMFITKIFLPAMKGPGALVLELMHQVRPAYAAMNPPPPHDDHLHEAMQRLILQYLVENRDNPIPLVQGHLRPVKSGDGYLLNRGPHWKSFVEGATRGQKRRLEADEDGPVKRLNQSDSPKDDLTVL
ncbi:hypothetical protein FKP32DRAFT_1640534 [Trametes sanguinea]|nr:hypothetical protein FKP32DRAFT_1640534 [Trametes sanguinea]